jgi:hypothetical protein
MPSFDELVAEIDRVAIDVFGDKSEDGEPLPVTYTPSDGDPVQVTGIFGQLYELAKGDPDAGVETLGPAIFFRLEDLPVDPEDDDPTLTIRGDDYRVIERRPDGQGGIVLGLRLVS